MALPFPLNPALKHLPVYEPGRPIEEVARELGLPAGDIIKLASNENPLGPSPKALAAMQSAVTQTHLYPDGNAYHLKSRLADKLGLKPCNLILGNGSNEIIEFLGHALLDSQAEVVVSQYCFAVYPLVTLLFGAKLVTVPAKDHGHDLEAMLAAVTPATRALFVANPNNPTGTLASRESLQQLVARVPARVVLVLDEAYVEFLEDPVDFIPEVSSGTRPNLILMRTFSKIHGLAGLRLGYGIGHPEFIAALEKVRQPFNTNAIAQAGALAALEDEDHVRRTRRNNAEGLRFLERELQALKLELIPSHANFILVRVGDGRGVFQALQKLGVIVRPMAGYQLPEWIRVSVGTPSENARCVAALQQVLAR
ncbi:MAG: histidinol-phosphate transaminase [Verrucomicrobia bacterium]|jgi:histidinol-phosphate aminotransferase|nr:histidinol-phosphate transaminase [Verrucomicrobiota bacterium]